MDDILKELSAAYQALSTILVSGDAVDAMALARVKIRNAFEKIEEIQRNVPVSKDD